MQFLRAALLLFLLYNTSICSQSLRNNSKPLSQGTAAVNSYTGGLRDTCLDKRFSVVFYGIQDSGATRTPSLYNGHTNLLISEWNRVFKRICVSFAACSTIIVPHYDFEKWYYGKTDQGVLNSYNTPDVINVYLPEYLEDLPGLEVGSYAYVDLIPGLQKVPDPMGAINGTATAMVINTGPYQPSVQTPVIRPGFALDAIHAMGHFFGLPDTFSELSTPATPTSTNPVVVSTEFADGSNSSVNGDLFSDTEADCYPAIVGHHEIQPPCGFFYNIEDGKGDLYTPPVDNYMSKWPCACRFTQQQYNYMAWYIVQKRLHLH